MHTQDFKGDTDFLYVGNQDVAKKAPTRNYPKDVPRLKSASAVYHSAVGGRRIKSLRSFSAIEKLEGSESSHS